jgi:hypothetical protein
MRRLVTTEATMSTDALLAAILAELRGLRADIRCEVRLGALRAAIEEELDDAAFTVNSLLEIADTEPQNPVAHALGELIDLDALPRSRSTALGRLLAGVPWLMVKGAHRGAGLYVLRTSNRQVRNRGTEPRYDGSNQL